nr:hypothetical protein Iba_chr12bCG15540 [Ipomoea batatas]
MKAVSFFVLWPGEICLVSCFLGVKMVKCELSGLQFLRTYLNGLVSETDTTKSKHIGNSNRELCKRRIQNGKGSPLFWRLVEPISSLSRRNLWIIHMLCRNLLGKVVMLKSQRALTPMETSCSKRLTRRITRGRRIGDFFRAWHNRLISTSKIPTKMIAMELKGDTTLLLELSPHGSLGFLCLHA